ncbi:MAG: hypothetical protein AAFP98_08425 [Pseudomonadota bacterium]
MLDDLVEWRLGRGSGQWNVRILVLSGETFMGLVQDTRVGGAVLRLAVKASIGGKAWMGSRRVDSVAKQRSTDVV